MKARFADGREQRSSFPDEQFRLFHTLKAHLLIEQHLVGGEDVLVN
jgi:hypothetical protein